MHGISSKNGFSESLLGLFNFSKSKDYKRLSRYLINVHQASTFEEITKELSKCINEIFCHDFFALAVKTSDKMRIWVEPSVFRETIISVIERDFNLETEPEVYPVNVSKTGLLKAKSLKENLYGKDFVGKNFQARLYILPGKKILSKYHGDIISDMVVGLENALSRQMNLTELKDAATTDPLTGCYNRREFEKKLTQQVSISRRYEKKFSLVMFDIDHFKKINDNFGHLTGDGVLREISDRIRSVIRAEDSFFRYGGEEFVLILPETDSYEACILAERLREEVAGDPLACVEEKHYATASFGVASYPESDSPVELIKRADLMLYRAKNSGRNKVMSGIIRICKNTAEEINR